MAGPVFEYIPVIGDGKAKLKVVSIEGISTKHTGGKTDRGRLYGTVASGESGYTLDLYSSYGKAALTKVLTGTSLALGAYFDLSAANTSGLSGRALIESFSATSGLIAIPTFATDQDVLLAAAAASVFPAYDATYGLAYLHAAAMREILTAALPARLPNLMGGNGLAAFVPGAEGVELPDLTQLANADQLRVAQAHLVWSLAGQQKQLAEEWKDVMDEARKRFEDAMDQLKLISRTEADAAATDEASRFGSMTSTWRRG